MQGNTTGEIIMCYVPSFLGTRIQFGLQIWAIGCVKSPPGPDDDRHGITQPRVCFFPATVNPNIIIFDTQSVSTRSLIRVKFLSLCRFRSLLRPQSSCLPTSFRRRKFCLVSHVAANTENQAKDKERRGRTLTACREALMY